MHFLLCCISLESADQARNELVYSELPPQAPWRRGAARSVALSLRRGGATGVPPPRVRRVASEVFNMVLYGSILRLCCRRRGRRLHSTQVINISFKVQMTEGKILVRGRDGGWTGYLIMQFFIM